MAEATQHSGDARKQILYTALILTALTALEFLIAFTVPKGNFKFITFILLTIVKAFYIIAKFMHLGDEVKKLIYTILIPFVFIIWLIIGMMVEGNYWGNESQAPPASAPSKQIHEEGHGADHHSMNNIPLYTELIA